LVYDERGRDEFLDEDVDEEPFYNQKKK